MLINFEKVTRSDYHEIIDGVLFKKCRMCDEWKAVTSENFYVNKSNGIDGYNTWCKQCSVKRTLDNRNKNREENLAKMVKNAWKYRIKPETKMKQRERSRKNHQNGNYRKWQRENPEKIKEYAKKRQHKKHQIKRREWIACKEYFDYSCAYCGMNEIEHKDKYKQQLHKEHVDHNGANDISNCVPSCRECNSKKWENNLDYWYNNENELYNENRYKRIKMWLETDHKNVIEENVIKN